MLPSLTPFLTSLGPAALLVVMAIVFTETGLLVGFFLPGDSLLFTAGLLTASGAISMPVALMVLGAAVAAVAGDQVGYLLGRRYGTRLFERPDSRFFRKAHAQHAQVFFERHGSRAVVLARFVPVVRTFTPVVAGIARMPYRRYLVYNAAGGVVWCTALVLAGYFLGGVAFVAAHVEVMTLAVVVLSLVPAGVAVVRHRSGSRAGATVAVAKKDEAVDLAA